MSGSTSPSRLLRAIEALDRHTTWMLTSSTPLSFDVGHPQGLTKIDDDWLFTTVHMADHTGHVLRLDASGSVLQTIDVTDGVRYHPGGVDFSPADRSLWIATAEYRPHSTTCVSRLDEHLETTTRFDFDDHLGAICDLGDETLFAASWGSRTFYRLSYEGNVLKRRTNPSHFVDYQDLRVIAPGTILASGVADMNISGSRVQLGGIALVDAASLHIVHEAPITASMPSGRSITYNGFHLGTHGDDIVFHCLVDDTVGAIGNWVTP